MKTKLTILFFIILFSSFNVYNQVVCHDNFTAATSTPLDGLNTGEGWSDAWSAANGTSVILDTLDMGFGLLKTSDPYLHAGSNLSRPLDTDPAGPFADYLHADSGFIGSIGDSLWFSYLIRINTTTDGGISVGFNEEAGSNPDIQLNINADPKFWLKGSNLSHSPLQSADSLKVYFVVWKIKFTSALESEVSIYFDPPVGDVPGSPARVSPAYSSTDKGLKISHLQIISSGNSDIDEIRFGKTYADVAPEFPYDQDLTPLPSPENITDTTIEIGGTVSENSTFIQEHGIEWKSETDYSYNHKALGSGSETIRHTIGIKPGSTYSYRVYAVIADSVFYSDAVDYAVDLNTPAISSFTSINMTSLNVEINPNDNPTGTEYAIFETGSNKYVTKEGLLDSDTEIWFPNWGEPVTLSGLTANTDYTFRVKARPHGGGTTSEFSDAAMVHTLNFPLLDYSQTGFNSYTFYHDDYSPDPVTLEFTNSETGTFTSAAANIVEQTDSTVEITSLSDGEYWFRLVVNSGGTNHISDTLHLIHVNRTLNTSDYLFVDNSSTEDVENGTEEFPFKTIQKAVDSAEMGNTVIIKEGVYREEVRINKQNLTFIPFGSDSVILNGSIPLYDWEPAGAGVYKTIMDWDITEHDYSNQVFIDGEMIFLTRWPKETSENRINNPTWATFDEAKKSGNFFTFTDEELPEPTSQWLGAQIFINPSNPVHGHEGQGWSGTIASVSGKSFVVECNLPEGDAGNWGVEAGNYYYLYNPDPDIINTHGGITSLLGYGEWWKNGDTLYVKTRNGSIPTATIQGKNLVESKKFPFFFRPVKDGVLQNIAIKGFNMFATSITTDDNFNKRSTVSEAENVVIDNVNIKYVMHTDDLSGDWYHQWSSNSGIILSGRNCTLKNSKIDWSAASAVSAIGLNHKITNNVMTNINYHGTEPGVINFGGRNVTSKDFDIGYNTIMHTPHDGIVYQELLNSDINNPGIARIHHNYLYNTMTQYFDLGVIKGAGQYGQWIRIDHNVIHNKVTYEFGNARAGLYFDYGSDEHDDKSLFIVDHNLIYNIEQAILLNHLNGIKIFNNTLIGEREGIFAGAMSSLGKDAYIQNNVYNSIGNVGNATKNHNYIPIEDEWQTFFTDSSTGNFTLTQEADSLINQGTDVSPWNDPLVGNPDIGAYEYGTPAWKAGASLPALQTPYLGIPWDMPDTIQAEDYDIGGNGVAYADSSQGNLGNKYRKDDVDITSTNDGNGGYKVYETKQGEWLEYTIDVPNSGTYSVVARIASLSDGVIEIFISDSTTGEISFTATGGEETWTNVIKTGISLEHGTHVARVVFKSDDIHLNYIALVAENTIPLYKLVTTSENGRINLLPSGNFYDEGTLVTMIAEPDGGYQFDNWSGDLTGTVDSIIITMDSDKNITANFSLIPQDPFGGVPWPIPGKIEVEDYDVGGQNISYYDNTPGNHYNLYREDDVDIHELYCNSLGVGRQASGEWKEYTINVSESGTYNIDVSYAAPSGAGGSMEIYFDKNNASTGTIEIPDNTASWRDCGTITVEGVTLEAGEQIMTINPLSDGFNLNYVFIYDPGNIPLYTVNTIVAPVETGTIEIEPVSENYAYNSTVTFTAVPADGYTFESWAGDIMLDDNPATISVLEDMEVIANFITTIPKYDLIINVSPAEGGMITLTPRGGKYEEGTEVTISASPNDDYKFVDWSGDASGISTEITVTMNENKSITANFKSTVGMLTNENNMLTFYPNPVNDKLNVITDINGSYEIVNIVGKVVKQGLIHNTNGSPWTIDVNNLEKGIYLLKIKGKEQANIMRFVKN